VLVLGFTTTGTPISELEQYGYSFGFIDPDLTKHVLAMDPMAEGGDDPRWVDLHDVIADVDE
jgi:hypothetical protein